MAHNGKALIVCPNVVMYYKLLNKKSVACGRMNKLLSTQLHYHASTVEYTTSLPCIGLSESDSKLYANICIKLYTRHPP